VLAQRLERAEWAALESAHVARADELTRGWRERAGTGASHPVDDYLYTYYPYKPRLLRRWHPGANIVLTDASASDRATWKWYASDADGVRLDTQAFRRANGATIDFITRLLSATASRTPQFACFGLHEWAMVYRSEETRHEVPLRLGQEGTDAVVDAHPIACSHFDAYRFFTPAAIGLNKLKPTRETQPLMEQSGCLHAGMDVYKWATKLVPMLPGDLLLDCFELARDIRELDMRASPYDLSDWGYSPVAIETPEGKAEYVAAQRGFAVRGDALRARVVAAVAR
jgi:hypothetical protein